MKTRYWLPFAALAAFAADCGTEGTETGDSATDTFCYDCEFVTNSIQVTCDNNGTTGQVDGNGNVVDNERDDDTVTYDIAYSAWAAEVVIDLAQLPAGSLNSEWEEQHVLASTDNVGFEADGTGDAWQLVLDGVSSGGSWVAGQSTILTCSDIDYWQLTSEGVYDSITVKVAASPTTDYDSASATCGIFGERSADYFAGDGCECFESFLQTPPANPCGDH